MKSTSSETCQPDSKPSLSGGRRPCIGARPALLEKWESETKKECETTRAIETKRESETKRKPSHKNSSPYRASSQRPPRSISRTVPNPTGPEELRNLHLLPLFGLLWQLGFGAACRPDVELSIPCEENGHFSCPTGFHCGDEDLCVPEEAPPLIIPDQPLDHALVSGSFQVEGQVSSPLGIARVEVLLESAEEEKEGVEVPVALDLDESRTQGVFSARLQSGWIPNGDALLSITAHTKGSTLHNVHEIPLRINNEAPSLRLHVDNLGKILHAPTLVQVSAKSPIGLARFEATLGGVLLPFKIDWHDLHQQEAQLQLLLDPEDLEEGEAELHISAHDLVGQQSSLFRHFLVPARGNGQGW